MQQASVELKNRGAVLTTITKEGCMKLSKWCCGVALAGSLVATDAFADAGHTGFEGIVGLSGAVLDQDVKLTGAAKTSVVKPKDIMAGLTGTLSLGYRFNSYAGVYLEQDLGGIWWTGDTKKVNDHSWFIGGTYVMGRGIFRTRSEIRPWYDVYRWRQRQSRKNQDCPNHQEEWRSNGCICL